MAMSAPFEIDTTKEITLADIALALKRDHECRDRQHDENRDRLDKTRKELKINNIQTLLTLISIIATLSSAIYGGLTFVSKATQYFDNIQTRLSSIEADSKVRTEQINALIVQQRSDEQALEATNLNRKPRLQRTQSN